MKSLYQKYLEYIKKSLGKYIDYDGKYANQCVDFVKQYAQDIGYPITTYGNAKDFIQKGLGEKWVKVKTPIVADIIIFPNGQYGHIAVFEKKVGNMLHVTDQNKNGMAYYKNNAKYKGTPVSSSIYVERGNEVYYRVKA